MLGVFSILDRENLDSMQKKHAVECMEENRLGQLHERGEHVLPKHISSMDGDQKNSLRLGERFGQS